MNLGKQNSGVGVLLSSSEAHEAPISHFRMPGVKSKFSSYLQGPSHLYIPWVSLDITQISVSLPTV